MIEFLLLLVDQLRSYVRSLLWPAASPIYQPTPLRMWHQLLYVPTAAKNRLYAIGATLLFLLPLGAQAQLISITTPTSICAGQTTTLNVAINLPLNVPLSALTITATAPDGLTATVNALTSSTNATVSVTTSPTLTTGVKSVTVTAKTADVSIGIGTIPGISLSVPVDISITGLPVVAASTQPIAVSAGSVLTLGTCATGNILSYTLADGTLGTGSLALTPTIAGQPIRIACNGTCAGLPTTLALPNIAGLSLAAPPVGVCVNQPLSLTLLPTGIDLTQAGITLTAATPSGALTVGALGPDGVLTVSGTNLTVGNPTSVTVTALLNGVPLVSATVGVNVLAQPAAPTQPTTSLTATVGSVLSLTGLCPVGTTLTTGPLTGNGIIPVPTVTAGVQSLTVLCSNGTCLGLPTVLSVNVVAPTLGITAPTASICVDQPLSLTLLPTGIDLTQAGITLTAATPSGALTVGALGPDGVLTVSGTNLTVGNPTSVTVTALLNGVPLVSATVGVNVLAQPAAPTQPTTSLTATVGSVLSLTGLCPTGTTLTTGALIGNGIIPVVTTTAGTQSLTVLCSNGTCLGLPTVVNVLVNQPLLGLNAPLSVCVGAPLSLTLLPTGIDLTQAGITLTAATPSGALTVGALGPDGVLTVSGTNLTVGNPTSVTVTALLNGVPLVSANVGVNVLAQPAAPTQPTTSLTATVGSVLSLTGLCPVGTTLTTGPLTGNGIIPVVTTTAGTQSLTVLCSNGTCLSLPTIVDVNVVTPIISASATAAICFGQPLSLTVLPANFNLADGIVSIGVTGPVGISASAINSNGVITITGLPAGSQNLTVTASVAGAPVASVQVPVSVNTVQPPTVVTSTGGSYPAGVSSLSVTQNTGNVLFTVSCASGTSSYTGTGGITGSGDFSVATTATGVYNYSVVCTTTPCVSAATVVSVSVVSPANQAPVLTGTGITSPQTATVGVGFTITTAQAFSDPDGGTLTYSASPLPNGITINPQTGVISGTASTTVGSPFTVVVTATDPQSASVSTSFVLNVVNPVAPNQAPVLTGTGITSPQTATVGVGFTTTTAQAFNDPDGGTLTYSASPLPNGITINPQTGVISGTASTTVGSPFTVTVTATDPQQASVSTTFVLNVVNANQAPVLTGVALASPQTATVGAAFSTPTAQAFSDPDGGTLTYSASPLPNGITINPQTGVISGTASTTVGSPFTVIVTATDPQSASVSTSFVLNVVNPVAPNQAPVLTGVALASPQTATVGVGFTTTTAQAFNDPDGGTLTYSASPLPNGITINPQTGVISGTASTTVGSPFTVIVTATDPQSASVSTSFVLNVVNPVAPNQAPVLTGTGITSPQTATVGVGFTTPTAQAFSDPDGGTLTYSASPLPNGITINPQTGVISGTASTTVGSPFTVIVTATDPQSASVSTSFVLNVVNPVAPNQAPVLTGAGITSPQTATVGVGFTTTTAQAFSDPDGGTLTYSASPLPNGITINPQTGVISGTASTTVGSPFTVTVTATDPQQASVSTTFVLNVVNANQAPVLTGVALASPQTATVGAAFSTPTAQAFSDPDGGTLTYSASPLPNGITINPQTGVISGTASTTVGSPFTVIVTATDPQSASVSTSFVLNVVNPVAPNQAPVLTGVALASPQTATVGVGFTTTTAQAFSDPDGGTLTYSASPLPNGITINPQTGVISGTASTTVGAPFTVIVTATDPQSASVSTSFVLNVVNPVAPNQAPVLTGVALASPQTTTVGAAFSTPTAQAFSDPDGGTLTYSASPLPNGITINPQTGVISGTASTTVGAPFTVTVTATDPQSASVSTSFVLNVVNPAVVNPGAPFSITSVTTNNCQVISAGERQVTFTPNYAGLNGQTVTFRVVNETMPTTAAGPYTLRLYTDNPTIQLRATQAGSSNEASFSYNWLAACGNTTPTNQAPVLTGAGITSPQTATVGASFSTPTAQAFNDPDGGTLTYSTSPLPAGITINPQTGVISGTPSTTVGSPFTVTVTATDPQQASVSTSFVLNVVNPAAGNQAPVLTGTGITNPQTATVGVGFTTTTAQAFRDPDGGTLTYSASPLPAGIMINPQTGVISGTPSTTVGSPFTVTVTATDPQQASVSTSFVLNVVNPTTPTTACGSTNLNGSPLQATAPNFTCDQIKVSGNIQFTVTGGSANGGAIEFKAIGVTDWTTNCQQIIDRETRTACDAAPIEIQVRQLVNGSYVYGKSYVFDIRRECPIAGCSNLPRPNRAPVVSAGIPNQVATVGHEFKYNIPANAFTDPDGDELLYMSSRLPDSFTFSSGFFGAYPTTAEVLSVTVTAYDNSGGQVSTTFTITVNPNPSTQPPTTPQPPVTPPAPTCGSTNLNGSTLQATAPNFTCEQLKTSGNIQFTATGGNPNGGAIEFRAIGVTDWTTNCQQIIDRETRTACDAAPIEIQVRQLVNGSYVYGTSYTFNIRQVCPIAGCGAARVAAEVKAPLDVQVLGNPTREESVSVDIRGAEGQRLQLMVVDTQGFPVSEHTVESAATVEHQTVKLGRTAGVYLLRVYSQHQMQTVKVLKQ